MLSADWIDGRSGIEDRGKCLRRYNVAVMETERSLIGYNLTPQSTSSEIGWQAALIGQLSVQVESPQNHNHQLAIETDNPYIQH